MKFIIDLFQALNDFLMLHLVLVVARVLKLQLSFFFSIEVYFRLFEQLLEKHG